jgi:aspartate aminotransferase
LRGEDLDAVAEALRASHQHALLLSDEAYAGVIHDDHRHLSPASHPELAGRTLIIRSFSKTHAMAAWRVGYIVGPAPAIDALARVFGWQSLAIDAVAQAAALAAFTGPQDWIEAGVAELGEARGAAIEAANGSGVLRAEVPQAAAFVWAQIEGDEDEWSEHLAREYDVAAVAGHHFGARTPHLRIPFGGRREAREALVARLRTVQPPNGI